MSFICLKKYVIEFECIKKNSEWIRHKFVKLITDLNWFIKKKYFL